MVRVMGWICGIVLCLIVALPSWGQLATDAGRSEALARDAQAYAGQFGVSLEEALERLELQGRIGLLGELLEKEVPASFGGLWIEHEPEFRVVTLFTEGAEAEARSMLNEAALGQLAPILEIRRADVSMAELEAQLEEAERQVRAVEVRADLQINVHENRVEILTPSPSALIEALDSRRLQTPANTQIVGVDELSQPTADLRGGRPLSQCTSGFSVRSHSGELGLATAGHCSNSQTYRDSSTPLTLKTEHYAGSHDVQWHTATCNDDFRNQIFDGSSNRTISGTVSRSAQAVGTYVCKYGKTTGASCGLIWSRSYCPNYVPNGRSTFITVYGNNIIDNGDSGGPWYVGSQAYGVSSGKFSDGDAAIYMAVDWMSTVGYSVLTTQAAVTPWVSLTCTNATQSFSCSAAGGNGTPPYTFSNWSYWGNATSWSASGSSISGNYGLGGCPGGGINSIQVQVQDACGRTGFGGIEFLCPDTQDCDQRVCDIDQEWL